ncbi:MAG: hypothetical protein R2873_29860 [Caldilineaceae bacterium]
MQTVSPPVAAGILLAGDGGTVNVASGTYVESNDIVIANDLTIIGELPTKPVITPNGNTNSAWFKVNNGATLNLSNVVLDGDTNFVWTGIEITGAKAAIDNGTSAISGECKRQPYRGIAVAVFGGDVPGGAGSAGSPPPANLDLSNSTFNRLDVSVCW